MKDIPLPDSLKDLTELERAEACLSVALSMYVEALANLKEQADE